MRKLFRIAAYLVLITFVLSVGDWPFVDEILAEQVQIQQEALAAVQADVASSTIAKNPGTSHAAGSLYQSLVNFIDMPRHGIPTMVAQRTAGYLPDSSRFISATVDPFERPPIFSLS